MSAGAVLRPAIGFYGEEGIPEEEGGVAWRRKAIRIVHSHLFVNFINVVIVANFVRVVWGYALFHKDIDYDDDRYYQDTSPGTSAQDLRPEQPLQRYAVLLCAFIFTCEIPLVMAAASSILVLLTRHRWFSFSISVTVLMWWDIILEEYGPLATRPAECQGRGCSSSQSQSWFQGFPSGAALSGLRIFQTLIWLYRTKIKGPMAVQNIEDDRSFGGDLEVAPEREERPPPTVIGQGDDRRQGGGYVSDLHHAAGLGCAGEHTSPRSALSSSSSALSQVRPAAFVPCQTTWTSSSSALRPGAIGDDRPEVPAAVEAASNEAATLADAAPPAAFTDWSSLNRDIDEAIDSYVTARGSAQPLPQDFAAAFKAAFSFKHGDVARAFNDKCSGPFPSALLREAVDAVGFRLNAEKFALALAPYCADPENFEAEVIGATCLSQTQSSKQAEMLEALASRSRE